MLISTKTIDNPEDKLLAFMQGSKRSHSFIFSGIRGIGKSYITRKLVMKLLKTEELNIHPNVLWLDAESKKMSVEEVRNIYSFMYRTVYHNDVPKIVVVDGFDKLNIHSVNALLKLLEEPTKNTYFILISHNLRVVPDTIKSRCIVIKFAPTDYESSRQIVKTYACELSDEQVDKYLYLSSTPGIAIKLIREEASLKYERLLELLYKKSNTELYEFIEKNFFKGETLDTFCILVRHLISRIVKVKELGIRNTCIVGEERLINVLSKKSLHDLTLLLDEVDYLVGNTKTIGLDTKSVVLIILNQLIK